MQSVGYGEETVSRQSDALSSDLEADTESLVIKWANDIKTRGMEDNDRDRAGVWCNLDFGKLGGWM